MALREGQVDEQFLVRSCDLLRHRGPDDSGVWISPEGRVGLANRRLAIIDLSPRGHQPMADRSGRCHLTFNGEIYNHEELRAELSRKGHAFRSHSDTEVILEAYRAWGPDCLARLNGMFAFALYDADTRRILLARDRAGEKPLFYRHVDGKLAFASELKVLMADPSSPPQLDLEALNFYLTYRYVPGEYCIVRGCRKLPQGAAMTYEIDSGAVKRWQYWSLPDGSPSSTTPDVELVQELDSLLEGSVRRQLRADVPVGIMLSGGIDSSLLTAVAARVSPRRLKTFTVSFRGHDAYDESPHARLVARHFATDHTELEAESTTPDVLPELARQFDEPIADSSMVPTYLVSRLIREHATVALGGDGGDELFGGYRHYNRILRQEAIRRVLPEGVAARLATTAATRLPVGLRGRNYVMSMAGGLDRRIAHAAILFDARTRAGLLSPVVDALPARLDAAESYKAGVAGPGTPLRQATVADFKTYLVDDILVKVDRTSMLASLEARAPWLDRGLVEFAFGGVPERLRATITERKVLPRLLGERLLPKGFDLKRKRGFSVPMAAWLKGDWGRFTESVLRESDACLFDKRVVESLLEGQRKGRGNDERLFALTVFELWRRHYRVSLPR